MTTAEIGSRVSELLSLPYRKVLSGTTDEGFLAEAPELPGCFTAGETEAEALELLHDAMAGWFESRLARGLSIPTPRQSSETYSGRVLLRIPPAVHRQLVETAAEQGVSLNQWTLTTILEGLIATNVGHGADPRTQEFLKNRTDGDLT